MKFSKLVGIILFVGLFFLLNNLDQKYAQDKDIKRNFDFSDLVYGINAQEAKSFLNVKFITIDNDGDIEYFLSRAVTPIDALVENGYSVSNMNKIITTSPLNELSDHAYIVLKVYKTITEDITLLIPYERITSGQTLCQRLSTPVVKQQGVLGTMTQTVRKTYENGNLIATETISSKVKKFPINEITILVGPDDSPGEVPQIGYNCNYWNLYIDNNVSASSEEKQWLKFTMKWESGCNAESNQGYYKGLFQWDPCLWYEQFPNNNIFDGRAQIKRTLAKLRAGANPKYMWPAVYKKYVAKYGELSWLK